MDTLKFKRYNSKVRVAPIKALDALISDITNRSSSYPDPKPPYLDSNRNLILDYGTI